MVFQNAGMRLVLLLGLVGSAAALRCYCTEDHCVPYGACDGNVCLVGILRDNNQVIRTCGSRQIGCHRYGRYWRGLSIWEEDDKWTDLCACNEPFCNTFAYLRAHTSNRRDTHNPDDVPLVFQRMDRTDDEPAPPQAPISTRTSLLTLLLVVVPLTVGAATVMTFFDPLLFVSLRRFHLCAFP